jgi:hypothetical protein
MFKKLKESLKDKPKSPTQGSQSYPAPSGPPPGQSYHPPAGSYNQPGYSPQQQQFAPPAAPPPSSMASSGAGITENQMASLKRFDTVLLVDDSGSMEMYWDQTRDALIGVVEEACKWDSSAFLGLHC